MTSSLLPSVFGKNTDPDRPVRRLHDEIDRVFRDFRKMFPVGESLFKPEDGGLIAPKLDISETDKTIEITAEIPGLEEKDIDVSVAGNVLTLQGEKATDKDESTKEYRLIERSRGRFARSIPFAFQIPEDAVSADMENGLLKISIKKPAQAKASARKIPVSKS